LPFENQFTSIGNWTNIWFRSARWFELLEFDWSNIRYKVLISVFFMYFLPARSWQVSREPE